MHGLDIHVRTIGPTPFPTTTTNLLKVQPPTNVLQRCLRTSGPVRIVLIGPPKSGKSSFVGSACTVLSDRSAVDHQLSTFPTTQVLHILLPGTDIVLTDTWPVTHNTYQAAELSCLLSGHIPHGHPRPSRGSFGTMMTLSSGPPATSEADAVVIFATSAALADEELLQLADMVAEVRSMGLRLFFATTEPEPGPNWQAACLMLGAVAGEVLQVSVYDAEAARSTNVEREVMATLLQIAAPQLATAHNIRPAVEAGSKSKNSTGRKRNRRRK